MLNIEDVLRYACSDYESLYLIALNMEAPSEWRDRLNDGGTHPYFNKIPIHIDIVWKL